MKGARGGAWSRVALAFALAASSTAWANGAPAAPAPGGAHPSWRVGLPLRDAPYSDFEAGAGLRGLYVEWWRSLAAAAGATVDLVPCAEEAPSTGRTEAGAGCLELLRAGAVDFIGPRRFVHDPTLAFTRPVHRRFVFAATTHGLPLVGPTDLASRSVVVLEASSSEAYALMDWAPRDVHSASAADAAKGLANRSYEVAVFSGVGAPELTALPGVERTPLWFRWQHIYALPEREATLADLDALIDQLAPDSMQVRQPWLLGMEEELLLSPQHRPYASYESLALLAAHPTVRLGAATWPPLTVYEDGRFDGLALRVVSHHLRRAGLTPVFVGSDDWMSVKAAASDDALDGLGYVIPSPSPPSGFAYTRSMLDLPMVVVTRLDEELWTRRDDLRERRVITHPSYLEARHALGHLPARDVMYHEVPSKALERLRSGEVDAWVEFLPVARETIHRVGATDVKLAFRLGGPEGARTALQSYLSPLIPLIDHSIQTTSHDELDAIYAAWSQRDEVPEQTVRPLWPMLVLVLFMGSILLFQSRQVSRGRRTVQQRERALRRAQRLSGVGSFELHPPYRRILLDGDTPHILGLAQDEEAQALEDHLALFHEPDALRAALEMARSARDPIRIDVVTRGEPQQIFCYELTPPSRVEDGAGVIVGTLENVTAERARAAYEKELEEEVLHLQKIDAIGRLAGGVAHDFNNVLAATMANAELAQDDLEAGHPARESVDQVLKACERARDLVQQILAFSRRHEEEYHPLRLDHCLREAVNFLRASIPATVDIDVWVDPSPSWVRGHDSRLTQVVVNLITNAVDAVQDHGHISVRLEVLDSPTPGDRLPPVGALGLARLVVEDDGPGIDPEARGRIFDPFFTTKPIGKGTGLGLSIVHGVVRAHGGTTEVESRLGGGARFVVYLPLEEPPAPTPEVSVSSGVGHGESVLIVDDEVALSAAYARILRQCGLQVTISNSSRAAREIVRAHPGRFDLVLTDLTMPDLTGEELAQACLEVRSDLPIVLITGFGGGAQLAGRHLFRAVLEKPVPTPVLINTVLAELERGGTTGERPCPPLRSALPEGGDPIPRTPASDTSPP